MRFTLLVLAAGICACGARSGTLDDYQVTGSQDSSRTGQLSFRINF